MTRRQALAGLAVTAVGCGGTTSTGGTDAGEATGTISPDGGYSGQDASVNACSGTAGTSQGAVTSYAVGTWSLNSNGDLIIGHDTKGLFAFSAICTHQGCGVDPPSKNGSTYCSCHGSVFDGNGAVVTGPAKRALQHYAVSVCDGELYVDSSTAVAATTRTPPA